MQDSSRAQGTLIAEPQVILTQVSSTGGVLPVSGIVKEKNKTLTFEDSTVQLIPDYVLESEYDASASYHYKRKVSMSFGLPQWCTEARVHTVTLDAYLAVPAEEVTEIIAENPEKWVISFDVGKWGAVLPLVTRFVAARGGQPHRWYFTAAIALVASVSRQVSWPVVFTLDFRNAQNISNHLNLNLAVQAGSQVVTLLEEEVKPSFVRPESDDDLA